VKITKVNVGETLNLDFLVLWNIWSKTLEE